MDELKVLASAGSLAGAMDERSVVWMDARLAAWMAWMMVDAKAETRVGEMDGPWVGLRGV